MAQPYLLKRNNYILYFEYFVVFLLIFYDGKANIFVLAIENWDNPVGLLLPLVCIGILWYLKDVQFNHKYWLLILGFTIYFIASTINYGELHPRFYGINIINFTITYIVISGMRYNFFKFYEEILFYLCVIAIIFWTVQNIIPVTFIEFLRNFEFSAQPAVKGNVDFNTIVYTVSNFDVAPNMIMHFAGVKIYRNAGFAWEPGAFATYINMAIFINLIRHKFKLRNNRKLWVFIIALATTFSTTGYSMFILFVLFLYI